MNDACPLTYPLEISRQVNIKGLKWDQVFPEILRIWRTIKGQRCFGVATKYIKKINDDADVRALSPPK